MATAGKSLAFDNAEIDELLNLKYGGQRTFSVLSVLYPGLDLGKVSTRTTSSRVTFHEEEAH